MLNLIGGSYSYLAFQDFLDTLIIVFILALFASLLRTQEVIFKVLVKNAHQLVKLVSSYELLAKLFDALQTKKAREEKR